MMIPLSLGEREAQGLPTGSLHLGTVVSIKNITFFTQLTVMYAM